MSDGRNLFTPDMMQATKEFVKQEAAPDQTSWEAIAALFLMVVFYFTRPPLRSNGIPELLEFPRSKFVFDFVVLSFCAGLGFSAWKRDQTFGQRVGGFMFLISGGILVHWFFRLL